jgi:hypothetical protein
MHRRDKGPTSLRGASMRAHFAGHDGESPIASTSLQVLDLGHAANWRADLIRQKQPGSGPQIGKSCRSAQAQAVFEEPAGRMVPSGPPIQCAGGISLGTKNSARPKTTPVPHQPDLRLAKWELNLAWKSYSAGRGDLLEEKTYGDSRTAVPIELTAPPLLSRS